MNKIAWDDRYSVHHKKMDAQHRRIVRMINDLIDHQQKGSDVAFISDKIAEMTDYCLEHLSDEEALLQEVNFPGLAAHIELHNEFRSKVVQFCTATSLGLAIEPAILGFLASWWQRHICEDDLAYRDLSKP